MVHYIYIHIDHISNSNILYFLETEMLARDQRKNGLTPDPETGILPKRAQGFQELLKTAEQQSDEARGKLQSSIKQTMEADATLKKLKTQLQTLSVGAASNVPHIRHFSGLDVHRGKLTIYQELYTAAMTVQGFHYGIVSISI